RRTVGRGPDREPDGLVVWRVRRVRCVRPLRVPLRRVPLLVMTALAARRRERGLWGGARCRSVRGGSLPSGPPRGCPFRGKGKFHAEPSEVSSPFSRRGRARRGCLPAVGVEADSAPGTTLRAGEPVAGRPHGRRRVSAAAGQGLPGGCLLRADPAGAKGLP